MILFTISNKENLYYDDIYQKIQVKTLEAEDNKTPKIVIEIIGNPKIISDNNASLLSFRISNPKDLRSLIESLNGGLLWLGEKQKEFSRKQYEYG